MSENYRYNFITCGGDEKKLFAHLCPWPLKSAVKVKVSRNARNAFPGRHKLSTKRVSGLRQVKIRGGTLVVTVTLSVTQYQCNAIG